MSTLDPAADLAAERRQSLAWSRWGCTLSARLPLRFSQPAGPQPVSIVSGRSNARIETCHAPTGPSCRRAGRDGRSRREDCAQAAAQPQGVRGRRALTPRPPRPWRPPPGSPPAAAAAPQGVATSEAARRIIAEEVVGFIKSNQGVEVRECGGGLAALGRRAVGEAAAERVCSFCASTHLPSTRRRRMSRTWRTASGTGSPRPPA